ncbi:IPT/TIG domain-containing protein [Streptomyces sp. NBC_01235]|uniref:IPT/TIG domain-containing protein n=1 Tax=Streptomyces sp. NBC_01235 TaxID=2903788 RepID=UPI002E11D180|nr:IPT/TIG domain-containing protein [Streptomyces sp. NBC_01235]
MKDSAPTAGAVRPTAVIAAVPVLTSVVPSTGPAAGNNNVVLNGSGFTGATGVMFGTKAAVSYTVDSSTKITAVAPSGTGTVAVTVKNPGGTSNSVAYTYAAQPSLTAVSPGQGPSSGGTTVILTGANLSGATAVTFGNAAATGYTVNSATQITAVAPAGTGAAPITVTTPGGTSGPVYFFYLNAPTVTAVSPGQGPSSGGTTVILTGADLSGATAVTFGNAAATSYTVDSPTQITAVAPAGTGSVAVTVTGPGGVSNSVIYTYVTAPVLSSLVPAQGPTGAGASITLTGNGLTTTTAVHFGATPAVFTVLSDTTVTALVPAGAPGPISVNVTTIGGTSNSLVYTRVGAPVI